MAIGVGSVSSGSHLSTTSLGFETTQTVVTAGHRDWQLTALANRGQFDDPSGHHEAAGVPPASWSLFGLVWPSAISLANQLHERIDMLDGLSVLELGCGLALPSLVLASNQVNVVASDMHPLAANFLAQNCRSNHVAGIPFRPCLWPSPISDRDGPSDPPYPSHTFDWIVGSDLLYETGQPEHLLSQIKLSAHEQTHMMITDPGRGELGRFERGMSTLGFSPASGNDNGIRWRIFTR